MTGCQPPLSCGSSLRPPCQAVRCSPEAAAPAAPRLRLARRTAVCARAASGEAAAAQEAAPPSTSGLEQAAPSGGAAAGGGAAALPAALLRRVAGAADANEALDLLAEGGADALTEERCGEIMAAALERDNPALAQAVFRAMTAAAAASGGAPAPAAAASRALAWPPAADTATAASLVVGLARALRTKDAVAVVHSVRSRGLPTSEDVQFGFVVGCPLAQDKPLAVVQPQQGVQQVADSFTRYEYELYSGAVASAGSEALGGGGGGWAAAAARTLGLLRRPAAGAVHALLVETPGGQQRSFRFATATPDVPAKVGDRVTVVCAPQTAVFSRRRLLSAAPPGSKPGEALSLSNHTTRAAAPLLRPPAPGAAGGGLPAWALPAAAALAASDAATSLIDPALPFLVTGALAAAAASAVAGSTLLLPRLKQLPDRVVDLAATRQRLLGQHSALERRVGYLVDECSEDVRALARLWQLQTKMGAVAAGGAYGARLERVAAARRAVEARLAARVGAVDAYARVISMIEIEVEMETEVPLAEVQGIEAQIARLAELEELQEEWQIQAEAQDEVERLLRSTDASGL